MLVGEAVSVYTSAVTKGVTPIVMVGGGVMVVVVLVEVVVDVVEDDEVELEDDVLDVDDVLVDDVEVEVMELVEVAVVEDEVDDVEDEVMVVLGATGVAYATALPAVLMPLNVLGLLTMLLHETLLHIS